MKNMEGAHYSLLFTDIVFREQNHHVIVTKPNNTWTLYIWLSAFTASGRLWSSDKSVLRSSDTRAVMSFTLNQSYPDNEVRVFAMSKWRSKNNQSSTNHSMTIPVSEKALKFQLIMEGKELEPGQNFKFRLVYLQPNPDRNSVITPAIYIENNEDIRVKAWFNVTQSGGLDGFNYRIPSIGSEGQWKICAWDSKIQFCERFKVVRDLSPLSFLKVHQNLPSFLRLDAKAIKCRVCIDSKMTKLRGSVKIDLCIESDKRCTLSEIMEKNSVLDGCIDFNFLTKRLNLTEADVLKKKRMIMTTKIVENISNETLILSQTGALIVSKPFELYIDAPDSYQPGLPFIGIVRTNDLNDEPVRKLQLWIDAPQLPLVHMTHLYTDKHGEAQLRLPPFPTNLNGVNITIRSSSSDIQMIKPEINLRLKRNDKKDAFMLADGECKKGELKLKLRTTVPLNKKNIAINVIVTAHGSILSAKELLRGVQDPVCEDTDDYALGHYHCRNFTNGEYKIECRKGWRGDNCLTPICSGGCVSGFCRSPDKCVCRSGWSGYACNVCFNENGCEDEDKSRVTYMTNIGIPKVSQGKDLHVERLTIFVRNERITLEPKFGRNPTLLLWFINPGTAKTNFIFANVKLTSGCYTTTKKPTIVPSKRKLKIGQRFNISLREENMYCALFSGVFLNKYKSPSSHCFAILANRLMKRKRYDICAWPASMRSITSSGNYAIPTHFPEEVYSSRCKSGLSSVWKFEPGLLSKKSIVVINPTKNLGNHYVGAICSSPSYGPLTVNPVKITIENDDVTILLSVPSNLQVGSIYTVPVTLLVTNSNCSIYNFKIDSSPGLTKGLTKKIHVCESKKVHIGLKLRPTRPGHVVLSGSINKYRKSWPLLIWPNFETIQRSTITRYKCITSKAQEIVLQPGRKSNVWSRSTLMISGDQLGLHSYIKHPPNIRETPEVIMGDLAVNSQLMELFRSSNIFQWYRSLNRRLPNRIHSLWERMKKEQRSDGGFSPIPINHSKNGSSIWMTAVAAGSIWRSRNIVNGSGALSNALWFLQSKIQRNGCFQETSASYGYWFGGGLTTRRYDHSIALTAAVMDHISHIPTDIVRNLILLGRNCLTNHIQSGDFENWSTHTLALLARQMVMWNPNDSRSIALMKELIRRRQKSDENRLFWMNGMSQSSDTKLFKLWRLNMFDQEISAIAESAHITQLSAERKFFDYLNETAPAIEQLGSGRWYSMVDKLESLRTIEKFTKSMPSMNLNVTITVQSSDGTVSEEYKQIQFKSGWDRSITHITQEMADVKTVSLKLKGEGCIKVQLNDYYSSK